MMFAAAAMGMVVASEDAMRHPVGNQIDFAAISAMEHFFGQVPALVIMHRMVHANDTFHLVRERHQVVRHNHNRHGFAKIRKHVVFFLAQAFTDNVHIQEEEIAEYVWVDLQQARKLCSYDNDLRIINKAETAIKIIK